MLGKHSILDYGSHILFDKDGDAGGGGTGDNETGDQTNWKSRYDALQAQIQSEYVPKKSYTGLQQTLQQTVDAKKTAEELAQQAQGSFAELESKFNATLSEAETLRSKTAEYESTLGQLKGKQARTELIMSKFPGLATFEGKGLLPDAPTPEELESKLAAFQEQLGTFQEAKVQDFKKGESPNEPPPTTPDGKKASKELLAEATKLQAEYKFDEYEKKMNEYYAALSREEKK